MGGERIPILNDHSIYETWKKEVKIWQLGTGATKRQQASKLIMNMAGKPKEVAIQIESDKLGSDDGVTELIAELDKLYEKDSTQSLFTAIDDFESYRRPAGLSIDDYIREFQQKYKTLMQRRNKGKVYEDGILAYRLLHQASLSSEQQRLIRATTATLSYEEMEKALKRTYGEGLSSVNSSSSSRSASSSSSTKSYNYTPEAASMKMKDEPVYYQNTDVTYSQDASELYYGEDDDVYYQEDTCYDENDSSGVDESTNESPDETIYMNGSYYHKVQRGANYQQGQRFSGTNARPQYRPYYTSGQRPMYNHRRPMYNGNNRPFIRHSYQQSTGLRQPFRPNNANFAKKKGCHICGKEDHWVRECQYNTFKKDQSKMTFFKSDFTLDEQSTFLMGETTNKALLDTGASSTVCGKTWYNIYEESLTEGEKSEILTETGNKAFKFGDGNAVISSIKKTIPITLCGNDVMLEVHVVDNDIPLLLSRESMKKMRLIINLEEDRIYMGEGQENLQITRSGHVVVPIGRCADKFQESDKENIIQATFYVNPDDSTKCATHLHRYFAHSSASKIKPFLESVLLPNKKEIIDVLQNLDKTCEFCLKHKSREKPHRKVALPQGSVFNEIVAMDLKKLKCGVWIVHFIDTVTRFSVAASIANKGAEEILTKTFMHWISVLGRPSCFISDNGGEFVNAQFNEMCSLMNVKVRTSPAESPWCQGTVERHNGILGQMIEAVMDDSGCNVNIAIAWAMNAKNSLNNVFGFSPYQLVMGRNPRVPDILHYENLPALNHNTASEIVADNLNAMESARKAFIELENSNRLKRILRERVYESANERYINGDVVYYKREKSGWQGPATVVGQLGNQVLLKHGGMLIRMHPCKVVLKSKADGQVERTVQHQKSNSTEDHSVENGNRKSCSPHSDLKDIISVSRESRDSESSDSDDDTAHLEKTSESNLNQPPSATEEPIHVDETSHSVTEPSITIQQRSTESTESVQTEVDSEITSENRWQIVSALDSTDNVVLKKGDIIRYRDDEDEEWQGALVMSRAGKATGKYPNSFNVHNDGNEKQTELNVNDVAVERLQEEQIHFCQDDIIYACNSSVGEDPKITAAKEAEIKKFDEYGVYTEVKDTGQKAISTRWVITTKTKGDNFKARLVARGFEELVNHQVDAPTVNKTSLRILFTICVSNNWIIESLDITSAFLQSDGISREVYLKPPVDVRTKGVLWKLKKPVYGLGDSARMWYLTLKNSLLNSGCSMSVLDKSVFRYYSNNKLLGIMVTHVDDVLYAGNAEFNRVIIQHLKKDFKISRMTTGVFTYLGWSVKQEKGCITVDQKNYADGIKPVLLSASRKKNVDEDLTAEEQTSYQGLLGKLLWLSSQTRPDLNFYTMEMSTFAKKPKVKDLLALNKVVKKIDYGSQRMCFRAMHLEKDQLQLVFYSDASLGNLSNGGTGRGYIIFLCNQDGVANVMTWSSNKIKRVVHSVFAAETLSCVDAVSAAIYIRQMLSEILYNNPESQVIPIVGYVDSRQLSEQCYSTKQCSDKRVRLDISGLQQDLERSVIKDIKWKATGDMLADCLTKRTANSQILNEILESGYYESFRNI